MGDGIASLALDYVVEERAIHSGRRSSTRRTNTRKLLVDNPDVDYYFAVLDDRESYVLRGRRPAAAYDIVYWGLVLVGPWMESLDYRFRRTHTNNRQTVQDADGSWTLVISTDDRAGPTGSTPAEDARASCCSAGCRPATRRRRRPAAWRRRDAARITLTRPSAPRAVDARPAG